MSLRLAAGNERSKKNPPQRKRNNRCAYPKAPAVCNCPYGELTTAQALHRHIGGFSGTTQAGGTLAAPTAYSIYLIITYNILCFLVNNFFMEIV